VVCCDNILSCVVVVGGVVGGVVVGVVVCYVVTRLKIK